MKTLTQIGKNLNLRKFSEIYSGKHDLQNNINPKVKSIVDKVFEQLTLIFPAWEHNWKDKDQIVGVKREWVKSFYENNINSIDQIKLGLSKARKIDSDFLPSCGKFVSWCSFSPEDLGYPNEQELLKTCIDYHNNQKFVSPLRFKVRPIIIELCKNISWSVITTSTKEYSERHFKSVYRDLILSGYVEPIESDSPKLGTEDVINENLSEQQKEDKRLRGLNNIRDIKKQLKGK